MEAIARGAKTNFRRKYSSIAEILDTAVRDIPNKGFTYIYADGSEEFLSYRELRSHALKYLKGLNKLEIFKGDIVGLAISDPLEYHLLFWACIYGGIVATPIHIPTDWSLGSESIENFKLLWNRLDQVTIITEEKNYNSFVNLKEDKQFKPLKVTSCEELLDEDEAKPVEPDMEDLAYMLLTSGTTSDPKSICLSYQGILKSVMSTVAQLEIPDSGVSISWLPHTHNLGLFVPMLCAVIMFNDAYFMSPSTYFKNPILFIKKVEEHGVTWLTMNHGGLITMLKEVPDEVIRKLDLSHLEHIIIGSESVAKSTIEAIYEKLGIAGFKRPNIRIGYGLSEATCASCFELINSENSYVNIEEITTIGQEIKVLSPGDVHGMELASVGVSAPDVIHKITDELGHTLKENQVGELKIKSEGLYIGHYVNGLLAPEDIEDGWLSTGDLAFIRDNHVYIVGRKKDIVVLNGVNYMANEIDDLITSALLNIDCGSVASTTTLGDDGEELLIFIEYENSIEEFIEIRDLVISHLNRGLNISPSKILPIKKLEKTKNGKAKRFKLRKMYENGEFKVVEEEINRQIVAENSSIDETYLPFTQVEKLLCEEVARILDLEIDTITLDKSFYLLGGQSIDFYRLLGALEDRLDIEIDHGIAQRVDNLGEMAELLEEQVGDGIEIK